MKPGDMVVTISFKQSDWRSNPKTIVRIVGLLVRQIEWVPYRPGDQRNTEPVSGWEVLTEDGLLKRKETALRLHGEVPVNIENLIRARDFATQKIEEWQASQVNP